MRAFRAPVLGATLAVRSAALALAATLASRALAATLALTLRVTFIVIVNHGLGVVKLRAWLPDASGTY